MSLHPQKTPPIPEETARVAHAILPQGNRYLLLRKELGTIYSDELIPDVRFHDLRHSAATILLGMGVPAKVVQEILGHSQISMTMDIYSHVLPDMQQEAMAKMNDLFDLRISNENDDNA